MKKNIQMILLYYFKTHVFSCLYSNLQTELYCGRSQIRAHATSGFITFKFCGHCVLSVVGALLLSCYYTTF